MSRRRAGLSLVEVLTVTVVLVLMGSFLFPVFAHGRESAQRGASLTRLRQLGQAAALYSIQNDEVLPFASGSHCYHLALSRDFSCEGRPALETRQMKPANAVLHDFGVPYSAFYSPSDRVEGGGPGMMPTWREQTATARYPGASFDYQGELAGKTMSEIASPVQTPVLVSLFKVRSQLTDMRQVCWLDLRVENVRVDRLNQRQ